MNWIRFYLINLWILWNFQIFIIDRCRKNRLRRWILICRWVLNIFSRTSFGDNGCYRILWCSIRAFRFIRIYLLWVSGWFIGRDRYTFSRYQWLPLLTCLNLIFYRVFKTQYLDSWQYPTLIGSTLAAVFCFSTFLSVAVGAGEGSLTGVACPNIDPKIDRGWCIVLLLRSFCWIEFVLL